MFSHVKFTLEIDSKTNCYKYGEVYNEVSLSVMLMLDYFNVSLLPLCESAEKCAALAVD